MTLDLSRGHTQADAIVIEQRQQCVRFMLRHVIVHDRGAHAEQFKLIRRHAAWLSEFFGDQLGYRLVVERTFARLHKRVVSGGSPRPVLTRGNSHFDRRRYALVCLILAGLEDIEAQTTLADLAERVKLYTTEIPECDALDLDRYGERQAFVDAVRVLVDWGVLRLADGDDSAFVGGDGDALYDIDGRVKSQMLSCSIPPSIASGPNDIDDDHYADTDAGVNRRMRHRLMRHLLEEPVLYFEELDEREAAYLTRTLHSLLSSVVGATGVEVEVRKEGIAVVDTSGQMTDITFPTAGTQSHAALVLGEKIARWSQEWRRDETASETVAISVGDLRSEFDLIAHENKRYWSKTANKDNASRDKLFEGALSLLEALKLISVNSEGVVGLPALARFAAPEVQRPDDDVQVGADSVRESPMIEELALL